MARKPKLKEGEKVTWNLEWRRSTVCRLQSRRDVSCVLNKLRQNRRLSSKSCCSWCGRTKVCSDETWKKRSVCSKSIFTTGRNAFRTADRRKMSQRSVHLSCDQPIFVGKHSCNLSLKHSIEREQNKVKLCSHKLAHFGPKWAMPSWVFTSSTVFVFLQVGVYPHQSSLAQLGSGTAFLDTFWTLRERAQPSLAGRHWEALELSDCSTKEEIKVRNCTSHRRALHSFAALRIVFEFKLSVQCDFQAQYRKLSVKYHPDKNREAQRWVGWSMLIPFWASWAVFLLAEDGAKERFQRITEAYEALKAGVKTLNDSHDIRTLRNFEGDFWI